MRPAQSRSVARKEWGDLVATRQAGFALEMPPAPPEEPLDVRAVVGQDTTAGTRRILLDAVPLPMPPSINHYWRSRVIIGKDDGKPFSVTYPSEDAKAYKEQLRDLMLRRKAWYRSENPLELRVLLCFKDDREQDLDNRLKPLQDALVYANVMTNDKQVKQLEIRQGPHLKPMVCFVTLIEILPDRIANRDWIKA